MLVPTRSTRRMAVLTSACFGALLLMPMTGGSATAAPELRDRVDYVALGDSFAAAPGVPSQVHQACARSSRNYPSLTAARLTARLTDVTCSGATTADLAVSRHGEPAQFDALNRGTDLVTVTIGGNDGVGFSKVLKTCGELSNSQPAGAPCREHFTEGGRDRLLEGINETAPKVDTVIDAVHRVAPRAKVLIVGYPSLFPHDGIGCASSSAPFAAGDFPYLRDTTIRLNAMLAERAVRKGATYVDTYTPSIGHDMCQPAERRWIEDLAPRTAAAPAHPNARGEAAMAEAVTRALAKCRSHAKDSPAHHAA
ncbi:SGNH/GDSL hydrolase family protein [Streptomyces sp. NPDC101110]|uniref:SGNH/GDSL hydrolase family protein n=1 Tax=Streptomyces sp. NPDC101110 TaxID=3366104 RepID=UPI003829FAC2